VDDKKTCLPRGRPRGFCVDQAVETALGLFKERGYDAVGVADLARAIGVAPPSLYAAFGSKAGLYARALDLYHGREGRWLVAALAEDVPADALLARVIRSAADAYAGEPQGCLICRGEQGCTDSAAAAMTAERRRAARDLIRGRLAAAGAAEPERLADYALAALHGLTGAARDGLGREALAEIAEGFVAGACPHGAILDKPRALP